MNSTSTKTGSEHIQPAVHLEFIQNQLENGHASAPEQIEQYHRALFMHHHGPEWEACRQEIKTRQDKLAFLEGRLKETQLRLSERTKLVPASLNGQEDLKPTLPWNNWDRAMFLVCGLGILGLITFGILNISFNLLESGLVTFRENPIRTYFWAALLPVGALSVKVGWDFLDNPGQRNRYLWVSLALGVTGVIVWVAAYALVYPTLSKGITEQIASLSVFDNAATSGSGLNFAGAKWVDVVTVAAQAIAEIFLSAVLGMYLTELYARHRPVRLAHDPAFTQLDQERKDIETCVERERTGLGRANGNLLRLENQLTALIAYGTSIFHREASRRQDQAEKKQLVLDQLSEHLRQHLDAIDNTQLVKRTPVANVSLPQNNSR
jgi:hypothetical protein